MLFFILVNLLASWTCVQCASLYGVLDSLVVLTDWARIGEFCFTIPEGSRGEIVLEFVVSADGHSVVLVKDDEMFDVMAMKNLHAFHPSDYSQHVPRHFKVLPWRHLLGNTTSDESSTASTDGKTIGVESPTTPTARTASEDSESELSRRHQSAETTATSTKGNLSQSRNVAPGVPRLESSAVQREEPVINVQKSLSNNGGMERGTAKLHDPSESQEDAHPFIHIVDNPPALPSTVTSVCDALVAKARVRETLSTIGAWYKLVLWVEPHVHKHRVSVLITRCGAIPNAQYHVRLTNPGGILKAHFSCNDQGLLEIYFCGIFVCALLILPLRRIWNSLSYARKDEPVVSVLFLGIAAFYISMMCTFLHFLAYAYDGLGLGVLGFIGALANLTFIVALIFVIGHTLLDVTPLSEEGFHEIGPPSRFRTSDHPLFQQHHSRFFRINFNAIPGALQRAARPMYILCAVALSAFVHTLVGSLRLPVPGEPLSPVEKLLQWRRPHGLASFSDALLVISTVSYLVSRCVVGDDEVLALIISMPYVLSSDPCLAGTSAVFASNMYISLVLAHRLTTQPDPKVSTCEGEKQQQHQQPEHQRLVGLPLSERPVTSSQKCYTDPLGMKFDQDGVDQEPQLLDLSTTKFAYATLG